MSHEVYMIDPPWKNGMCNFRKKRATLAKTLPYKTMANEEIKAFLSGLLPGHRHAVFMWATEDFLWAAEQIMADLGYKRHARFVWDKGNGFCPAFTVRYSHEYMLWFYKGGMIKIAQNMRGVPTTVIREKSRQHSRKPIAAYALIEALYPAQTKLDVFSREARSGWDQYGDEKEKFNES